MSAELFVLSAECPEAQAAPSQNRLKPGLQCGDAKPPAVVRRAMTADEAVAVQCIRRQVTFSVGHWDKRFMRELPDEITEKQAAQVWRIFKTYRRQIVHERKAELLALAEKLAAVDLRRKGVAS